METAYVKGDVPFIIVPVIMASGETVQSKSLVKMVFTIISGMGAMV